MIFSNFLACFQIWVPSQNEWWRKITPPPPGHWSPIIKAHTMHDKICETHCMYTFKFNSNKEGGGGGEKQGHFIICYPRDISRIPGWFISSLRWAYWVSERGWLNKEGEGISRNTFEPLSPWQVKLSGIKHSKTIKYVGCARAHCHLKG